MKFLVLQKAKQIPLETWAKILPAHFKYLDDLEKQGKIEASYHLIGEQGDVLIVNADSDDDLSRIIGEDPMFFYGKRKVFPLTTREVHKRRLRKILK